MTRPAHRAATVVALVLLTVVNLTWLNGTSTAQEPPPVPSTAEATTTTTAAPPPATPMLTSATEPTAGTATTAGARRLELRGQTPFVASADTFSVKVAVRDAPPGARLGFKLWNPITSTKWRVDQRRDRLDQWIANPATTDDVFASKFASGFPLSLFEPATDGSITANFPIVPASQPDPATGFRIDDAGVYPLTVSLIADDPDKPIDSFNTFLIRLPTEKTAAPPLQVATIVTFHAPVATQPDGTTSITTDSRTRLQSTIDVLDHHPGVPLTLDATPETITAMTPTDRPATPTDALVRAASGREVLSSTFVDIDVNAWVASQMNTRLGEQLTLGFDTLTTRLQPNPPADRHTWKTEGALSGESLSRLREFGVDQLVMPDSVVRPPDRKAFTPVQQQTLDAQPFDIENQAGGKLRAGAADRRLAGRLTASTNPALAAQITLADLALIYYGAAENPNNLPATPRGVVLDVPQDLAALRSIDAVLGALATAPVPSGGARAAFAPATLDSFFRIPSGTAPRSTTPIIRTVVAPTVEAMMGDYPAQLDAADQDMNAFTSMVARSAPEQVSSRQRLLDVSGAAAFDDGQRRAYLEAIHTTVADVAKAITAPVQDQITLTDFEAEVKVQLENALPYAVDVLVVMSNKQLVFNEVPNRIEIAATLQPGDNRLSVKVRTRTSCVCAIDLEVFSADHSLALAAARYRVRFTVISGLGLVLTVAAGFFLLLWWGKNWRKTARARKLIAIDDPGPDTDPRADTDLGSRSVPVGRT